MCYTIFNINPIEKENIMTQTQVAVDRKQLMSMAKIYNSTMDASQRIKVVTVKTVDLQADFVTKVRALATQTISAKDKKTLKPVVKYCVANFGSSADDEPCAGLMKDWNPDDDACKTCEKHYKTDYDMCKKECEENAKKKNKKVAKKSTAKKSTAKKLSEAMDKEEKKVEKVVEKNKRTGDGLKLYEIWVKDGRKPYSRALTKEYYNDSFTIGFETAYRLLYKWSKHSKNFPKGFEEVDKKYKGKK